MWDIHSLKYPHIWCVVFVCVYERFLERIRSIFCSEWVDTREFETELDASKEFDTTKLCKTLHKIIISIMIPTQKLFS